jgi:ATP synthase protein I
MTTPVPVGQEATLRALAAAMFRGAAAAAAVTWTASAVVAAVLGGLPGALSAAVGGALAVASSLLTLWLIRRTAAQAPQVVMIASLGGFLLKMIVLLAALSLLGRIEGLDRTALALTMLAVFLVVAGAEAVASARMRTYSVDPGAGGPPGTGPGA